MVCLILALTMAADPAALEVEKDGVRIRVNVRANVYTYEVTNLRRAPISRFEIPSHQSYRFKVPEGWEFAAEDGVFQAWAGEGRYAIYRGRTGQFSLRVSSKGAALGRVRAGVESVSGDSVVLDGVWGAVAEPRAYVLLVAGVVLAIFGLHTWTLARNDRKGGRAATGL